MPPPKPSRWSSIFLVCAACGAFAAFLYVFYFYSWTNQRDFAAPFHMFLFYGIPLLATIILLAGLRLPPSHRSNLVLLFASTAVSVYAGEVALALYDTWDRDRGETFWPGDWSEARKRQIERVAAEYGVRFDTRRRLEVIMDLQERSTQAVPAVSLSAFLLRDSDGVFRSPFTIDGSEVVPFGGVSNQLTVLCNETGEYVLYESDERGFHNPPGLWGSEWLDIAVIGDSYAHGFCVPSDKNFAALIRDHFTRTLNLGVAGTGPLAQLAIVQEYVMPLRPSVVLWFYFEGNDLDDLYRESRNAVLRGYLDGASRQDILHRQRDFDRALRAYLEDAMARAVESRERRETPRRFASGARRILTLAHLRQKVALTGPTGEQRGNADPDWELLARVMTELKANVESWGGIVYFVYLPDRGRFVGEGDFRKHEVTALARMTGLPVVDLAEAFRDYGDPLELFPFRRFGHYNEAGHKLVAENVLDGLAALGFVPLHAPR